MIVAGRSWIIPMSMATLLAVGLTTGCSTVESVTGFITGSDTPAASSAAPGGAVGETDLARLRAAQSERAKAASQLKGSAAAETAAYNGTVQDIADKLRAGTEPVNPQLLNQWTEARGHLARVDEIVARMRALDADLSAERARARSLADSATGESRAGFRQTAGDLDATGNDVAAEIRRHTEWLATERPRSDALLAAVRTGTAPQADPSAGRTASVPFAAPPAAAPVATAAAPVAATAPAAPVAAAKPGSSFRPVSIDRRKPFVIIRFDRDNPEYEQSLYEALQVAVDRSPTIRFDVVAVTPRSGSFDARKTAGYAQRVVKSMRGMGLSEGQARTYNRSLNGIAEPQVHLYVRRR